MFLISYRRDDTAQITGRIYDRLQNQFGTTKVFRDVDSIPAGVDFREHIAQSLKSCLALIAIIGPRWLEENEANIRRLDDPADFVRIEISQALQMQIPVIPVLIDGATLPTSDKLPDDLKPLIYRNAIRVDSGIDFHNHVNRLSASLCHLASPRQAAGSTRPVREVASPAVAIKPFSVRPYLGIMESFCNIQKALIKEGILHDIPDGIVGPKTMRAIRGFQEKCGMLQDPGALNRATIDTLFAWEDRPESPINREDPDLMRRYLVKPSSRRLSEQIVWLQQALRRSDCYSGPLDGVLRPDLLDSIRDFQGKNQVEEDGCLSYDVLLLAIEDEVNLRDLAARGQSASAELEGLEERRQIQPG